MKGKNSTLLVVNPISGGRDKAATLEAVEQYALENNFEIRIYETTGNQDQENIREIYSQMDCSRVIVAGGDGTIKMVAEALEDDDVVIGIIPVGSANGLSVDLNFPTDLESQIEVAFNSNYTEIDMININGARSLHLSDIGLNAELIKNYEKSSIRGKIGYALQTVNTVTDDPVEFNAVISANGKTLETPAKMIVFANSRKYGTGVVVNPGGEMNDGKFEIVVFKDLDLVMFGKIIAGNMPLESGKVEIISTDNASVTTDIPVHFQIDGEYCGEVSSFQIEIIPRQMKVAVPLPETDAAQSN